MTIFVLISQVSVGESKAKSLFPLADIWVKWGGGNGWDHSEGATQQLICIASIKVQLTDQHFCQRQTTQKQVEILFITVGSYTKEENKAENIPQCGRYSRDSTKINIEISHW